MTCTRTARLDVDPLEVEGIYASDNNICPGEPVQLVANILGGRGPYFVRWFDDEGNFIEEKSSYTVNPQVTTTYYKKVSICNYCEF